MTLSESGSPSTEVRTPLPGSRNLRPSPGALLILVLALAASVIDWLVEPYPLSDVHWDASIYLLKAKAYDAGGFLASFRDGARTLHDAVAQGVYPNAYWSFMRLGHIVLMGTIIGFTGTSEGSIHVLTWVYRGLLAAGLFFSAMLPVAVARVLRPAEAGSLHYVGALLSVLLYVFSGVAAYLSGNLVSEVPAIFLISLSAWSLIRAWESDSIAFAIISGCAGFLLYVVRMESVWAYVSFLVPFAWLLTSNPPRMHVGWKMLVISGAFAALFFLAYSLLFLPLTDPRLVISFAEGAAKQFAAEAGEVAAGATARIGKQLVAANGLLWVGGVLGVLLARANRAFQFGAIWLVLSLVPVGLAMGHGAGTETRMYTTLAPVLIFISTFGWGALGSQVVNGHSRLRSTALLGACVLLALVSQGGSYSILRSFPGMWRLQYVREYLAPMPFERIDFHLPELTRIEQSIATFAQPVHLIASPRVQGADVIMVIQYLYGARAGGGRRHQPANPVQTRGKESRSLDVYLANAPEQDLRFVESLPANKRTLLLRTSKEEAWSRIFLCCGSLRDVVTTEHYSLSEFTRMR